MFKNEPGATGLRDACIVPASGYYEWQTLRGDAKSRWLRENLAVRINATNLGAGASLPIKRYPLRRDRSNLPGTSYCYVFAE